MPDIDPYVSLGVARSATDKDIKKAYRKMALKYHPDRSGGDENKFKEVSASYEILSDPQKKKEYDMYGGSSSGSGGASPFGGGGGGGFSGFGGGGNSRDIFKAFFGDEDPFSSMFGGGGGNGGGGFSSFGGGGGGMPPEMKMMFGGMSGMSGFGQPQSRAPIDPEGAIKKNTMVYISQLQSASQHNGKTGKVLKFDEAKERYTIEIDDGSVRLALKQNNLTQIINVTVVDIESRPEFNGQQGTIRGWQTETGRYAVQLSSGQAMGLLPSKVQLPIGTRVTLQGLNSREKNGVRGEIKQYDTTVGRYIVRTFDGQALKVKRENVKV
tara:strand:+ start:72 stop:1046 length:975 start_codon:yes stop_codon:yes gene_type:complete